jgi:hypothetical protein
MKLFLSLLKMRERILLKTPIKFYKTTRRHVPHAKHFRKRCFELKLNTKKCHIYCQSRAARIIPEYV